MRVSITSGYGWRTHPVTGDRKFHNGIDVGVPQGTPIVAALPGNVIKAVSDHPTNGGHVIIEHDGGRWRTGYLHLSRVLVYPGTVVPAGGMIGESGGTPGTPGAGLTTGPHLHFILWVRQPDGTYQTQDPAPLIDWAGMIPGTA